MNTNTNFRPLVFLLCAGLLLSLYGCSGDGPTPSTTPSIPTPDVEQPYIKLSTTQRDFTVEEQGGNVSLSFSTNTAWAASSSLDWITISPAKGEAGSHTLTVKVAANEATNERKATVNLQAGTATASVTITQKAKSQSEESKEGELTGGNNEGYTPEEGTWD